MKHCLVGKYTYQVTEDKWERGVKVKTVEPTMTISDILEWVTENKIDIDSVRLVPINE